MAKYQMRFRTGQGPREPFRQLAEQADLWVDVWSGGLEHPICLRLRHTADGRLVCTGALIGAWEGEEQPEITARSLRIPLAEIVSEIANIRERRGEHMLMDVIADALDDAPRGAVPRARPGAAGHPEEFYEDVARRYRETVKRHPQSPTKALVEQYPNYSDATVRYWLRVCRRRGLLGRAAAGKAGEEEG